MTIAGIPSTVPPSVAAADARRERLADAAADLEAVFVQQLFKAMRASLPGNALVDGGRAEEIYTTLMDQHVARHTARERGLGLAEAILRQLDGDGGRAVRIDTHG